ncbi:MAG: ABC-2 transporter permease [Bacillota bacterium]|nr:ABC-2 transporter permease [Bacillota bacterium]
MKGLIYKDFVNIRSQLKLYIMFLAVFFVIGIISGATEILSALMPMLGVLIPITAAAYDDMTGWDRFALSMPVSRESLVTARYLFTEVIILIVAAVTFAEYLIVGGKLAEAAAVTAVLFSVSNLLFAVIMPIILKFGFQKARVIFMGIAAVAAAFIVWMSGERASGMMDSIDISAVEGVTLPVAAVLISLAVVFVSIKISHAVYRRKDF